jgi:hypothetical protein
LAGSITEPLLIVLAVNLNAWRNLCGEASDRDELIINAGYRATLRMDFADDDLLTTFAAHEQIDS